MARVEDRFNRIKMLVGDENFLKLQNAKVLICGVGGVGGVCATVLYRSGVVNLTLIDYDTFDITNQNRQIGSENLGAIKVEVFKNHMPEISAINAKIGNEFIQSFDFSKFDFVVDCIDDIPAKVLLANKLASKINLANKTPKFVSSMGGAKRLNPELITLSSIWQTSGDALARKFRYELRKSGFSGDFDVVYSKESPSCNELGSFMGVTATFGNFLASYVFRNLISS